MKKRVGSDNMTGVAENHTLGFLVARSRSVLSVRNASFIGCFFSLKSCLVKSDCRLTVSAQELHVDVDFMCLRFTRSA